MATPVQTTEKPKQSPQPEDADATSLSFREFFDPSARNLQPSSKLLALNGKRVKIVGFMAQMESPPKGAFYLCPRPVYSDESGAGTADLPVETVRVVVRSAMDRPAPYIPRAIEAVGVLEVGNHVEDDDSVSGVRLILDPPRSIAAKPTASKKKSMKNEQFLRR